MLIFQQHSFARRSINQSIDEYVSDLELDRQIACTKASQVKENLSKVDAESGKPHVETRRQ